MGSPLRPMRSLIAASAAGLSAHGNHGDSRETTLRARPKTVPKTAAILHRLPALRRYIQCATFLSVTFTVCVCMFVCVGGFPRRWFVVLREAFIGHRTCCPNARSRSVRVAFARKMIVNSVCTEGAGGEPLMSCARWQLFPELVLCAIGVCGFALLRRESAPRRFQPNALDIPVHH